MKVLLIDAPPNYNDLLEMDVSKQKVGNNEKPDFVHLFVNKRSTLESILSNLVSNIKTTTIIWVSWYKKSAKIPTEITEDIIREIAISSILVDVKSMCSNGRLERIEISCQERKKEFLKRSFPRFNL